MSEEFKNTLKDIGFVDSEIEKLENEATEYIKTRTEKQNVK